MQDGTLIMETIYENGVLNGPFKRKTKIGNVTKGYCIGTYVQGVIQGPSKLLIDD